MTKEEVQNTLGVPAQSVFCTIVERETGLEPATLSLATRCSTTELFPHGMVTIEQISFYTGLGRLSTFVRKNPLGRHVRSQWARGDLNPYSLRNQLLRLARLPISPLAHSGFEMNALIIIPKGEIERQANLAKARANQEEHPYCLT